ncbi:MAG: pilin, partial [Patescibacteria group bacterium]
METRRKMFGSLSRWMKSFLLTFVFLQVVILPASAIAATCLSPQIPSPETGDCYTPVARAGGGISATYTPLAPLTGLLGPGTSLNLTQYLEGVVQVTIGIAGILAVIMMVYCGLKLMGTPSASGRSEAKECIANAILGVLLAIGAWILLYTINPLLLSNELRLGGVPVAPVVGTGDALIPPGTYEWSAGMSCGRTAGKIVAAVPPSY